MLKSAAMGRGLNECDTMRPRFRLLAAAICFSGIALAVPARAELLIQIDKTTQRMSVTRDGTQLHVWPVSTGRAGHDTPSGAYKPFRLEVDHYSREWDDAPMPHSVFFTKRGHAIHGSYDVKKLGSAASAGCVRLEPKNAELLFKMVKAEGLGNVKVEIGGTVVPRRAPADEIARGAPRNLDPGANQQLPGQRYQYLDRDSRYPDPYYAQQQQPRYADPRYAQPQQPQFYYDAYGRLRPLPPREAPVYYQRRGYGYGWD
jgi:hypothetical protein